MSSTSISSTTPLFIANTTGTPSATTAVTLSTNVPSTAAGISAAGVAIDPTDATTFTNSTSVTVFDSLGNEHILTTYYKKNTGATNEWDVDVYIDEPAGSQTKVGETDTAAPPAGPLVFDPALGGALAAASPTSIAINITALASGATVPQAITLSLVGTTQNSGGFQVQSLSQDGFATGRLSGLDISADGLVFANFTNGQSTPLGKIVLANFPDTSGLEQIGNTAWTETLDSGQVLAGEAGTGSFGIIQSGALETSNIDLTKELVGLITAQRNFQANSKAIETNNAITQTIINLR